jgi:hypothetical protein
VFEHDTGEQASYRQGARRQLESHEAFAGADHHGGALDRVVGAGQREREPRLRTGARGTRSLDEEPVGADVDGEPAVRLSGDGERDRRPQVDARRAATLMDAVADREAQVADDGSPRWRASP